MSIDIYVFPTIDYDFSLTELETTTRQILLTKIDQKDVPERLIKRGDFENKMIPEESYYVETSRSLYIYKWHNEENQMYFLDGQAENVCNKEIASIAKKNETVGYHFNLDSKMHRAENELFLMIAVATAIAMLTDGLVLLADHSIENIPQGGYRWRELMQFIGERD